MEPQTPIQTMLAEMWAEVLGVQRVGIYDNFFELGGHSLLATRLMFRVRDAFQVDVPLMHLFETPTVAALAEIIMESQIEQEDVDELDELLVELENLPVEEIQKMLAQEMLS